LLVRMTGVRLMPALDRLPGVLSYALLVNFGSGRRDLGIVRSKIESLCFDCARDRLSHGQKIQGFFLALLARMTACG
jgi:hypothetical protein